MVENSEQETLNLFDIVIKTVEYADWSKYIRFSDSPEYKSKHDEMRQHLDLLAKLPVPFQKYLVKYTTHIKQTLYGSKGDFNAALEESMKNDPEGREIITSVLETMVKTFQDLGFGVLPKDLLDLDSD